MRGIEDRLKAQAAAEGFAAAGICLPSAVPDAASRLGQFLRAGWHGEMSWMERRAEQRGDPLSLWPEARAVLMLADSYAPDGDPVAGLADSGKGCISVYARNRDYHTIVKKRLKRLGRWLIAETGADIKVFVDTAPVMEKPLAQAAGIGWQGKHTNLVSRSLGSWFFLGAIFTTCALKPDEADSDRCGSCRRCIDICPTNAFPAPYRLDARRCISYLTIEHKGPVDEQLRPALGNRIFGCDDCLAVCPWNKFASQSREARYQARAELTSPDLAELAALSDAAFRSLFRGGPVRRIGRDRFVRNVMYAIGNSGDPALLPAAKRLRSDPSCVVADAARWACRRLKDAQRRHPGGK